MVKNEIPNCFLDFDGTLVDNKFRLYQFFLDGLPQKYKNSLSIEEFWMLKRLGIHEIDWKNDKYKNNISKEDWNRKKVELIESEKYLSYERLFVYTKETLEILKENYNLVLITRRENRIGFEKEFDGFGLNTFFTNVFILSHDEKSKDEIIKRKYNVNKYDIFVGDTEDDFLAGIKLGIRPFLVLSGIRSHWIIEKYGVKSKVFVINDIRELINVRNDAEGNFSNG